MIEFNPYKEGIIGGGFTPIFLEIPESTPFSTKIFPSKQHITDREIEVLQWLQQGKSSWEIARIMGLSERTVNYHIYKAMKKIKAVNRPQLITIALRLGLIDFK